jgi:hypothetical protein
VVRLILDYFNLTAAAGIAVVLGILWRRMNTAGVFASMITAAVLFLGIRYGMQWQVEDLRAREAITLTEVTQETARELRELRRQVLTGKDAEGGTRYYEVAWGPRGRLFDILTRHEMLAWQGGDLAGAKVGSTRLATTAVPLLAGLLAAVAGSLVSRPPSRERTDPFFRKIYVPIGQEAKLEQSLDEAVPADKRLSTAGGLFLVKPSLQSWLGFLITLAVCLALVGLMVLLLA